MDISNGIRAIYPELAQKVVSPYLDQQQSSWCGIAKRSSTYLISSQTDDSGRQQCSGSLHYSYVAAPKHSTFKSLQHILGLFTNATLLPC